MHVKKSTTSSSPRIAIIGAGPSGITTAKNCLQQGLFAITVFEKNDCIGGNWVFNESAGHSSIYETTHIISSKKLSSYEDFPMPDSYADYPSHTEVLTYFNAYASHFNLHEYIRFSTVVEKASRTADGLWQLDYLDAAGRHRATFDYLFVANGHHWDPVIPQYESRFAGTILHAHQYKKASFFKDQRVLVVGGGNSACDIAVEIARVARKTAISMRRGQHIFPKFIFGKPTDIAFMKVKWMPLWLKQPFTTFMVRVLQGRYEKYGLQRPTCKPLTIHPTINSELLYAMRHGRVQGFPGIAYFEKDSVCFGDGRRESFDTIIYATGYKISFPFFDKDCIAYNTEEYIPLYKKMMHPVWHNLFFIGLFQPQGCIWPLADYQAKIAAKQIVGLLKRPDALQARINKDMQRAQKLFQGNAHHALEVDYHRFREELLQELM